MENLNRIQPVGFSNPVTTTKPSIEQGLGGTMKPRSRWCVPLLGAVAAGKPIEANAEQNVVDLTHVVLGENRFALRVKGNSMAGDGILDGDVVICERKISIGNGDIVIALIDENYATLRRIQFNEDGTVTLIPTNTQLSPICYAATRIKIKGLYVGLVRMNRH